MKKQTFLKLVGLGAMAASLVFGGTSGIYATGNTKTVEAKKNTSAKSSAIYQGKIDNNSFEIKIKEKNYTVRVLDSNRHLIKGLKKGDTISLTYWVNIKGQIILGSKLAKIKPVSDEKKSSGDKKTSTNFKTSAIYIGKIDNNSFEVKIKAKNYTVKISDTNRHLIKGLKENDTISFTYSVNKDKQLILGSKLAKIKSSSIEKKNSSDEKISTNFKTSAIYIGKIDNNSFEVKIKERYYPVRVSDSNRHLIKELKTNDTIGFTYGVNKDKQLVLGNKLTKIETTKKNTNATLTGIYLGMPTKNSFEVKIGKEYKVIQIEESDKTKLKGLEEGDKIELTYWANKEGKNILGSKLNKK